MSQLSLAAAVISMTSGCSVLMKIDDEYYQGVGLGGNDGSGGGIDGTGGFGGASGGSANSGGTGGDDSGGGTGGDEGNLGPDDLEQPLHYYKLDEPKGEGSLADSGTSPATGTAQDVDAWAPSAGVLGGAYDMRIAGRVLQLPAVVASTDDFTIAFWLNRTEADVKTIIRKVGNPGEGGFELRHAGEQLKFISGDMNQQRIIDTTSVLPQVNTGDWAHVTLVFDSLGAGSKDLLTLWVDGELVKSEEDNFTNFSPINNATPLHFGGTTSDPTAPMQGLLDEIRVFDKALKADDIKEIYDLTKPD